MFARMHVRLGVGLVVVLITSLPATGAGAEPVHPPVVISQVYGGGGNVGATYTHDFVELLNRGADPVSLEEWSVQYATSSGSFWTPTPIGGMLPPGGRYLVQQAGGSGGTLPLPDPDAVGTAQMAAGSGKVALVAGTGILPCGSSCAGAPWVVDLVGYGSANDFEGTGPAPTLGNTLAALRTDDGCTDTDDNRADFSAGPPSPRSSAAPATPCAVSDPDPDDPDPGPDPSPDPGCEDTTPPALLVRPSRELLWPPNHKLVRVEVDVSVSDDTDPEPTARLIDATSSEPDVGEGSGDLPGDVVVIDDTTVLLRAERDGEGPGRIYTLAYVATDACGNEAVAQALVRVPHDRGHG